ncbi:hypothetical protein GQ457_04G028190 [Hibiscus cannabinus]
MALLLNFGKEGWKLRFYLSRADVAVNGADVAVNHAEIKLHRDHEGCTGIIGAGDLRRSQGSDGRAGGVDFLVVDSKQMEFDTVLRHAKLSHKGAVLACKNACGRATYGFRCHWVLERGTHVVRSVLRDSTTETIPILILSIEPFDADHHGKQRAATANENTILILQETWSDASGAMIIYAPIDLSSMSIVVNGGDSTYVAPLPSGFATLPNVLPSYHGGQSNSNGQTANSDDNVTISSN